MTKKRETFSPTWIFEAAVAAGLSPEWIETWWLDPSFNRFINTIIKGKK